MGTVSGDAPAPEKLPQRRAVVRRAAAAAWLVVIGVVVEQRAQGLFSGQPPAFLSWLGSVVSLQGDQPLWLKLLSLLTVVIVVVALGWLTSLAWQGPRKTAALLHLTLTHPVAMCEAPSHVFCHITVVAAEPRCDELVSGMISTSDLLNSA